jgi:hypothetical protein
MNRVRLRLIHGIIHSVVERTVYIANKEHYRQKSN